MPGINPGMILDTNDAIDFGAYADIFKFIDFAVKAFPPPAWLFEA
jgi:hypothetical protein